MGTDCPDRIPPELMMKDDVSIPFQECMACGAVGSHCNACDRCDQACDDKDANPLKIHSPAFIVKEIGQSTTWPGAKNTLSVTFATNIEFTAESTIYISGLVGAMAPDGIAEVFSLEDDEEDASEMFRE
eukprot:2287526-Rhodomonas_salina.1